MKIHFIGNKGVSMSWLAEYFVQRGAVITGSDITTGGHNKDNVLGADIVVYTDAVPEDNIELITARKLGIKTINRAKLLGRVSERFDKVVAIAGTHGKTTVTGMLGSVAVDSGVHIGGEIIGQTMRVEGKNLICEACEYRESFRHIKRDIAVVLNVAHDHPDYYKDYHATLKSFSRFASKANVLITTPQLSKLLAPSDRTVTVGKGGDCYANSRSERGVMSLTLWGRQLVFQSKLFGMHNADNFAFAATAASMLGYGDDDIAIAFSSFKGVKRRLERKGKLGRAVLIDDYAHHPDEMRASYAALKESGKKRILVVFQPHTYTRLSCLFDSFVEVLSGCDSIILPVFGAREKPSGFDGNELSQAVHESGGNSLYADSFAAANDMIRAKASGYDCVVIMSAGDTEKLCKLLLERK